ncbi:hypothetical protein [Bacillus sp. FJAT-45350]|uniref:hypothetical protein n=1 Tax=Bacillus sp. FJAT-45350 TaxID=2011014 RepID=UPI000BB6AA89|nr:hypothetical protein [Bacillus sp. FJAT-45350]
MKSNLFTLELMDGQERLFEALEMRGFLVEKNGPYLTLSKGSAESDYRALKSLLTKMNVPMFWNGVNFQLLVNRFPVAMMKRITTKAGHEFPVQMNDYHYRWRAFANRKFGLKVNTIELDPYIALLVKTVNQAGIPCLAGCDGHLKHAPNLQFSGVFNGAWFKIIQKHYLQELKLNYQWEVTFNARSGSNLVATKKDEEQWDMKKIYADTLTMAYKIKEHAEEIRQRKLASFKRSKVMKQTAELLKATGDYSKLVSWMEEVSFK